MNGLPSGTVTFLFTDIEGSTKLAQEHPDEMPALLARHHELLNQAFHAHNGYVFQIVGDSFSAAFHSASDALNAAMSAQRSIQSEAWNPAPIKVRMGIHTGTAQLTNENLYSGYTTLATSQRIMSAGHGGQVLLSGAIHELIRDTLPANTELLDLGEKRLKDLLRPEHLYQLNITGLQMDFPPLKTLNELRTNLPAQLTSFIGRENEVEQIKHRLKKNRLVTLTGSGGIGKTRLSIQVASDLLSEYPNGAWLVELASITDPEFVTREICAVLDINLPGNAAPLTVLTEFLQAKKLLLVVDNCEHLIQTCAQTCDSLLHACPNLRIIASSREALGIDGENSYHVPSLSLPDPKSGLAAIEETEAVKLFMDRATTVFPEFELIESNASSVAQICKRLDGIPLAIELAASRVKLLNVEQIASRLDDAFRLLTGGSRTALPRQQTLRALIDWSYNLLSDPEKILFRRLAVFSGGWTMEAAELVCSGEGVEQDDVLDLMAHLVDKSLIVVTREGTEFRYRRLETIRQYSREKFFETNEVETIRNRHLAFYVRYAEIAEEHMRGRARVEWTHRLTAEQDNMRTAMEWGLGRNPESALRIAANLTIFWTAGGYSAEGFRWIQQATIAYREQIDEQKQPTLRAKALTGLAFLYTSFGDNINGKRAAEESIAIYRQSQDKIGLAYALVILANPLEFLGERLQAEAALMESVAIARSEKNTFVLASALSGLTRVTLVLHSDADAAERYADEAIRASREAGMEWTTAAAHEMKGIIAARRKNHDEARTLFEKAFHDYQEIGARFNAILVKSSLAHMERELGNYMIAQDLYRETIVAFRDAAQTGAVAHQLECFGFVALAQDQIERALQLFAAANALREKGSTPMNPDEQVYFDEQLKGLHEKMDEIQFDSIWSKGHVLTMEQAIALALDE